MKRVWQLFLLEAILVGKFKMKMFVKFLKILKLNIIFPLQEK